MRKFTKEKIEIESDGKDMCLYILKPTVNARPKEKTPGILWIHGGGYVTGMAKMVYMSRAIALVKKYGAVVVTPEYRLSKSAHYPAALNDCYAALIFLKKNADAKVDVHINWFHAYDMLLPFKKISKKAIAEFEKQYLYAVDHYFAEQK